MSEERRKVEIDLEHYQEAVRRMASGLRDIKPALDSLNKAYQELNLAFHHVLEATQPHPMPIYDASNDGEAIGCDYPVGSHARDCKAPHRIW